MSPINAGLTGGISRIICHKIGGWGLSTSQQNDLPPRLRNFVAYWPGYSAGGAEGQAVADPNPRRKLLHQANRYSGQ